MARGGEQERLIKNDQIVVVQNANRHPSQPSPSITTEIEEEERRVFQFFLFICASTALRSFEAGIVASMMADIQADLELDYTDEGTIVASTDYGIAAGSLLAIFVFRSYRPKSVLAAVMFGTAACSVACAVMPTKANLMLARSVGGLLWSQAATHYPVWINNIGHRRCRGGSTATANTTTNTTTNTPKNTSKRKTIWLACTNVALLGGVIVGYIIGGAVRSTTATPVTAETRRGIGMATRIMTKRWTWVELYFLEGLLMAACGAVLVLCFDGDLLIIANDNRPGQNDLPSQEQHPQLLPPQQHPYQKQHPPHPQNSVVDITNSDEELGQVVLTLLKSPPFVFAVAITGCISGGIVYALYFVTQVCEARGMEVGTTLLFVTVVFVTAPAPGIIFGSWIVSTLGGYTDHVVTFGVAFGSAIFVLCSAVALPISWDVWGDWNLPFVAAFWIFAFAGAMSGPPLNGVAVSAVPHASHVASALQFSLSNAAKIVVPQIGGYVCSMVGLIDGFHATLVVSAMTFVVLSWAGLVCAMKSRSVNMHS